MEHAPAQEDLLTPIERRRETGGWGCRQEYVGLGKLREVSKMLQEKKRYLYPTKTAGRNDNNVKEITSSLGKSMCKAC